MNTPIQKAWRLKKHSFLYPFTGDTVVFCDGGVNDTYIY